MSKKDFWGSIIIVFIVFTFYFLWDFLNQKNSMSRSEAIMPSMIPEVVVHSGNDYYQDDQYGEEDYEKKYNNHAFPKRNSESQTVDFHLHAFDPNNVSKTEMNQMGIPQSVINNIINYRNKGGVFYKKEQLQKLYAMKPEWYKEMEQHIVIASGNAKYPTTFSENKFKKELPKPLDINTATESEFDQEWGVSPKVAATIVKYRTMLGGFVQMDQMKEIYTLPDSVFQHNKSHWFLGESQTQKININSADFKTLNAHPYIRKNKWAQAIIEYRKQHGNFKSLQDLQKIMSITSSELQKVMPYLTI